MESTCVKSKKVGVELVTSNRVNEVNMNYIVKVLNACSDLHDNCRGCSDEVECVSAYDKRCGLGCYTQEEG